MTAIFNPTLCAELVAEMREDIAKSSPVPWEASRVPMPPSIVCVRITDEHGEQVADCHDIKPWDNRRPTANASAIARTRNRLATVAEQLEAACAEVERLREAIGSECVEHVELNGHLEVAEQCHDYLSHEAIDGGDPTGKLRDFTEALRIVIDQCDRQRRRANWYETAYDAGKAKLIEHATETLTAELAALRADNERMRAVFEAAIEWSESFGELSKRLPPHVHKLRDAIDAAIAERREKP